MKTDTAKQEALKRLSYIEGHPRLGHPFHDYIGRLASRGIMSGYLCGGQGEPCEENNLPYFRPGNNATRGQTSKIVAGAFFPDRQPIR